MIETPLRYDGLEVLTLRQLDRLNSVPKGTTFKAFKRSCHRLLEGRDYFRLDGGAHRAWLEELRARDLVYPASAHLLLVTRAGYARMRGDGDTGMD